MPGDITGNTKTSPDVGIVQTVGKLTSTWSAEDSGQWEALGGDFANADRT